MDFKDYGPLDLAMEDRRDETWQLKIDAIRKSMKMLIIIFNEDGGEVEAFQRFAKFGSPPISPLI